MSQESRHPVALDDLYREVILDHYRSPRNRGGLTDAMVVAEGMNPSCGDELRVGLTLADSRLQTVRFQGRGCSISQASASMMTEEAAGRTTEDAHRLSRDVQEMLTHTEFDVTAHDVGDLEVLAGVARFPVRIKCALLAWKVLDQALAEATGGAFDPDPEIQTRVTASGSESR